MVGCIFNLNFSSLKAHFNSLGLFSIAFPQASSSSFPCVYDDDDDDDDEVKRSEQ